MTDPSKIKILVVEDEMLIAAKTALFLGELGYEVTAILPRAEDVLAQIEENMPDLALLDIQLKGEMDGIALALELRKKQKLALIFLTANTDDATFERAKAARPDAFLAKPFRKTDLSRAIELAISRIAERPEIEKTEAVFDPKNEAGDEPFLLADRIFIRHKERMVKVLFEQILTVEAERNYCRIFTKTKDFLLAMPMKSLEDKLPAALFQRIHRSHVVNLREVEEVGEGFVTVAGKAWPMSQHFRDEFLRRIQTV